MSNPSNLYAEKIFSEHPLVLWALDDKADYVSLITEAKRNIESQWTVTGATVNTDPGSGAINPPFEDSLSTNILGTVPSGSTRTISLVSPNLANFSSMNYLLGTFSIGTYFYSNSIYVNSVSIGFEYTDPSTSAVVQELETFEDPLYTKWSFISSTFQISKTKTSSNPTNPSHTIFVKFFKKQTNFRVNLIVYLQMTIGRNFVVIEKVAFLGTFL
jgi:hypothetical protein